MVQRNKKITLTRPRELAPELREQFRKATRLEWITVIYIATVIVVMMLTMQASQAMKAAWMEDTLSIVPAISFLVAKRFYERKPNEQYPYGYHRSYSIAYQMGAFALLSLGLYVFYESVSTLLKAEHPTIGSIRILGERIWMGWIMILVLLYSCIPSIILGQKKLPLANDLHNKILFTDANTQKADWQTALAAIAGIIGVGFGYWWADAAAACFISLNVTWDGYQRVKGAIEDLMDEVPTNLENTEEHPLVEQVYFLFEEQDWVKEVKIRMREAGEIFFTEVFVVPASMDNLLENIEKAGRSAKELDWKIHDIVIIPVREIDKESGD